MKEIFVAVIGFLLAILLMPEYPFLTRDLNKAGEWNCLLLYIIRKIFKI